MRWELLREDRMKQYKILGQMKMEKLEEELPARGRISRRDRHFQVKGTLSQ